MEFYMAQVEPLVEYHLRDVLAPKFSSICAPLGVEHLSSSQLLVQLLEGFRFRRRFQIRRYRIPRVDYPPAEEVFP